MVLFIAPILKIKKTDSGQLSDLFNVTKPAIYEVPEPGEQVYMLDSKVFKRLWRQGQQGED